MTVCAPAPVITILDALSDQNLFGLAFEPAESWRPWRVALSALFGLPLSGSDLELYRMSTGRKLSPTAPAREGWFCVGRRGGKSRVSATVAVFLAAFRDYQARLAPGERATVALIAGDRKQARTLMRYVLGLLRSNPMLESMVESETAESVDLTNRSTIEIHTASFRSTRGYSIAAAVLDEIAYWDSDESGANPDKAIVDALRPGMASLHGTLLGISSPHARRGVLYNQFRAHWGKEDSKVFYWKAPSLTMNPTLSPEIVEAAYAEDPAVASAEYGAEFRSDVESFVSREALDAVIVPGRHELPFMPATTYVAFIDPSGGASDSMTLAIAHRESREGKNYAVLDAVRETKPPFSPVNVVADFSALLREYRISKVAGDRYAGVWAQDPFKQAGIRYEISDAPKNDIYRDALPLINSGRCELLDIPRLQNQILGLERRASRGGRDVVDHAPNSHDDLCNAALGAVRLCSAPAHIPQIRRLDFSAPSLAHDAIMERTLRAKQNR